MAGRAGDAQQRRLTLTKQKRRFSLRAFSAVWPARLTQISPTTLEPFRKPRAVESQLYSTRVRVLAQLADSDAPSLHIGAQARAKLNCGSRSLAYVLFGDLLEFAKLRVW